MKFIRILMMATALLLVVSCNENKSQQADTAVENINIEEIISLANRQIYYEDYQSAAETLTQVPPHLFVEFKCNNNPAIMDLSLLIVSIEQSGNEEAIATLTAWGDEVEALIAQQQETKGEQEPAKE